jgi:Na+/H+ antiporter NhaD/arsenite permease-like protein
MLWIGGQITPANIIAKLLLPGLVCMLVPLLVLSLRMKGHITTPAATEGKHEVLPRRVQAIVLVSGLLILIMVPVFKTVTHLPPFMGMLLGLGILWVITEVLHKKRNGDNRHALSVAYALQKIDTPSILFFLGILSAIHVLEITGILGGMATYMTQTLGNTHVIVMVMGLLSSVVDNVPLVAATQAMYSLTDFPTDHYFWEFIAYSTGTGGSALIIGSAAGVAAMGMEKITFMWYLRKMTPLALAGFFAGAAIYLLQLSLGF